MRRRVYIAAMGVVGPWGRGIAAQEQGLIEGCVAIAPEHFDGLGTLPVARCRNIDSIPGEDRTITLLRTAADEVAHAMRRLSERTPPECRGVAAATSKGSILLFVEDRAHIDRHFLDFPADLPARVLARRFDLRGPSQGLVSACATGLHNITRAAEWIADGRADFAIAGSSEAALTPLYLASFRNLGAMSAKGCFPFDARHDGFVAGEGAALFVLATEDACLRAGIEPLAELRGWASASEAHHWTSTKPDGKHVASLARRAMRDAGVVAGDIDLVSLHGTGTPLNDEAESRALADLFAGCPMPPAFGVKGAIGHLMGAAGSVELACSVIALRGQFAPGTPGMETAAPNCGSAHLLESAERHRIECVLKWNMGFGGHLAGCVIARP